jgi:hypothetical protein
MPEPAAGSRRIVALAMMASAISLAVIALLMLTGVIAVAGEMRALAGGVVGAAAFVDLIVGLWFFSKGQSS